MQGAQRSEHRQKTRELAPPRPWLGRPDEKSPRSEDEWNTQRKTKQAQAQDRTPDHQRGQETAPAGVRLRAAMDGNHEPPERCENANHVEREHQSKRADDAEP